MKRYYQPEIETASAEEIRKIQLERLQAQVKRVYENVPFYRDKMDKAGVKPEDIRELSDLAKLPFNYKQDLRDTYPYGMFAVPLKDVVRLHASSGTTGKQVVGGYTRKDLDIWADCCARALTAAGCSDEDVVHVSYGYGLFTGGLGADGGAMKLGAVTVPVSSGNTKRQVNILKDFGSTILMCTPSYALHIAEVMRDMGVSKDEISLKAGVFGAEPWTHEMRLQIEDMLGIKAYDIYGLTEIIGPGVAFECEEQSGMHVNEDHFIVEVIDPETGEVLGEDVQGEIAISTVFGVVHSGWKGTGIIENAIKYAEKNYNAKSENFRIIIGPHIHSCCYKVDQERENYFNTNFAKDSSTNGMLSLKKANLYLLEKLGVKPENILTSKNCTNCDTRLGSFRRETDATIEKPFTVMSAFIGHF